MKREVGEPMIGEPTPFLPSITMKKLNWFTVSVISLSTLYGAFFGFLAYGQIYNRAVEDVESSYFEPIMFKLDSLHETIENSHWKGYGNGLMLDYEVDEQGNRITSSGNYVR